MNFNNDEKDVLFVSLNAIIKDYEVWNRLETKDVFLIKPIVEAHSKLNG